MTSNFHSALGSGATTGGGSAGDATRPPVCGVSGDSDSPGACPGLLLLGRRRRRCGGRRRLQGIGGAAAAGGGEAGGAAVAGAAAGGGVCANTSDDDSGRTTNRLDTIKERLMVRIIP